MWLTRFSISRPVITAMVFIALAIFGTVSFYKIGRSSNPPGTDFPIVVVYSAYPGASPQEMERLVVKPIEDQLDGIDNLDQLSATAQEGVAIDHRPVQARHESRRRGDQRAERGRHRPRLSARRPRPAHGREERRVPAVDRRRGQLQDAQSDAARRLRQQQARADPQGDSQRSSGQTSTARAIGSSTSSRSRNASSARTRPSAMSSLRSRPTTPTCPAASCASPRRRRASRCTPRSTPPKTCSGFRSWCPAARTRT